MTEQDQPRARIKRLSRWEYNIVIVDGLCEYGPSVSGFIVGWSAIGRRSAERKARKQLRLYLSRDERRQVWEIT